MQPSYLYKATVVRVIDGDSVVFDVDCGFDITLKDQNCRLYAIDTAETRGGTPDLKALGNLAKDYVKRELPEGSSVLLRTYVDKRGKFGRLLASVYREEGDGYETKSLNSALLDMHLAVEYHGQSKDEAIEQHLMNVKYHKDRGNIADEVAQSWKLGGE
tara:strand:+ start:508 stop:984 length:477 start_codon:yes stop_codon:yes gene_type:complete